MNLAQVTDCFPSVLDWEDSYLKNGGQRILGVGNGVHVEIFLDDVIQRIALILDDVSKETLHCLNLVTADQSASLSFLQTASVFAKGAKTLIEINGKLVTVTGHRFALKRIEDYLPVFISSRDLYVHSTYDSMDGAGQMNNMMLFKARFETSYRLEDVFLVMDLDMAQAGKVFFLSEVGRLEPNKS